MRRSLLLNVSLALVWTAVTGSFTGLNLLFGFLVGYLVMRIVQPLIGTGRYVGRLWYLLDLALFFVREIVVASMRILADVLTKSHRMRPAVIAFPLEVKTTAEITVLANLISLTPGTLSLDVSKDRSTLFIHVMYVRKSDIEAERDSIKRRLESRVARAIGPSRQSPPSD